MLEFVHRPKQGEIDACKIDPADGVPCMFRARGIGICQSTAKTIRRRIRMSNHDQHMTRHDLLPRNVAARSLRLFDTRHLIGVHGAIVSDRNVFADGEALLAKAETDLVITVALFIVEVPLAAGLPPQPSDHDRPRRR